MRRRWKSVWLVSLLMVGVLASTYPGSTRVTYAQEGGSYPPQVAEGFTFIHLTDPHMGSGAGNKFTPQIVTEIASLPDKPSFVVVGGDLTELGSQEQYAAYDATLAPLGVPIYSTLGNHESRWLDAGKGNFINRYGRRSYDFAYQGIHFVVLDTSVSNQTHGHFELSTLTWLRERLATWGKDAPVVVFMHHPVGYPGQRFIDNEQDFLDAVEGYHVVAVFTGHGHVNASWRRNGIPFLMTKAAMEGGYAIVRVGEGKLSVYTKTVGEEPVLAKTLLLAKGPHEPAPSPVPKGTSDAAISVPITSLSIVRPGPGTAVRQDFPLQVRVTPEDSRLEYRVDGGSWVPMAETATVPVAQMVPGFHVITVRATSGDDVWTKEVQILLDLATSRLAPLPAPVLAWRCPTGGGVQAQPVVDETRGVVYFGSNDGALRCVGIRDGKTKWQAWTSGLILSTPCLGAGTVYFGATDGRMMAVDAETGKAKWQFTCRGAVVASPLLVGDSLFFGDGEGIFHALDAATGKEKWQFRAGALIRSGAAWGRGSVYFGSWDGCVYALDAASGRLLWQRNLARQVYYAPVGGTPVFYLDKVYVTTPADPHAGNLGVHALDAATGEIVWQSTVPGGLSSPRLQNLAVVVNTAGGKVVALNPLNGSTWWEAPANLTVYDSSVVSYGGDSVLGGLWGEVVAWNGWAGQEVWRYRLGYRLLAAPAAVGAGHVFVPSMDGNLYALKVSSSPLPVLPVVFPDTVGHWAQESIARLARLELLKGYEDGSFRPAAPITRAEMAAVLARYLAHTAPTPGFVSRFTDVQGHWAEPFILALEERGLVQGEVGSDGVIRFRPDDPVSRAELATMLARLRGDTAPSPDFASKFADVQGNWAHDFILALEEQGLVKGVQEGKKVYFRPGAQAMRAEVAALLDRMAGAT